MFENILFVIMTIAGLATYVFSVCGLILHSYACAGVIMLTLAVILIQHKTEPYDDEE